MHLYSSITDIIWERDKLSLLVYHAPTHYFYKGIQNCNINFTHSQEARLFAENAIQ